MRRNPGVLVALIVMGVAFVALLVFGISQLQKNDTVPIFSTNVWHIVPDQPAQLVWQIDTTCLSSSTIPNGAVAIVGSEVVFHQQCLPGISVLKAVAVTADTTSWFASSPSSSQLVAVEDGVVNVEDKTRLIKYDLTGREVWRKDWPAQSLVRVSVSSDRLYAAQANTVDVLSVQTGKPIALFTGGRFIAQLGAIQVKHSKDGLALVTSSASQTIRMAEVASLSRETLWLDRRDALVFVSASSGVVDAYDIASGERRWTIKADALSAPLLVGQWIALYTVANTLDIYDAQTGERAASIVLQRDGGQSGRVHLAGAGGVVVMAFADIHEVIAVRLTGPLAP